MANLVVIELGLAIGLVLLAVNLKLVYVAVGVVGVALVIAVLRWSGRWFTQWMRLALRYAFRSHVRSIDPIVPAAVQNTEPKSVIGPEDARANLLRLVVPDLVVATGSDHERRPVGLAWHDGSWTAVLLVEPAPALITTVGATTGLPLGALVPCLEDRGVVLDAIQLIWHCYPGGAALPIGSPALAAYLELLGPLPAGARRTTWVAVRLDPRRCPAAIAERGGGVVGAHRALIGALSRVRSALDGRGVSTRPLDPAELLRAGVSSAELMGAVGAPSRVGLRERWSGVTTAGVGHASYAITGWPRGRTMGSINVLTAVRAFSATVAMSLSPSGDAGQVGLRGVVRVSGRTPGELANADRTLRAVAHRVNVSLTPLHGMQASGLAATLPLGSAV